MAPTLRRTTIEKTRISRTISGRVTKRRRPLRRGLYVYSTLKGVTSIEPPQPLADITRANAVNSPLLRLPAEVRNKIFTYALTHGDLVRPLWKSKLFKVPTAKRPQEMWHFPRTAPGWKAHAFLLPGVCRQIYSETATLAYSLNVFCGAVPASSTVSSHGDRYKRDYYDITMTFVDSRTPAQQKVLKDQEYIADPTHRAFYEQLPYHLSQLVTVYRYDDDGVLVPELTIGKGRFIT